MNRFIGWSSFPHCHDTSYSWWFIHIFIFLPIKPGETRLNPSNCSYSYHTYRMKPGQTRWNPFIIMYSHIYSDVYPYLKAIQPTVFPVEIPQWTVHPKARLVALFERKVQHLDPGPPSVSRGSPGTPEISWDFNGIFPYEYPHTHIHTYTYIYIYILHIYIYLTYIYI